MTKEELGLTLRNIQYFKLLVRYALTRTKASKEGEPQAEVMPTLEVSTSYQSALHQISEPWAVEPELIGHGRAYTVFLPLYRH